MVEYVDGSVIAQLGMPDMRVPIAYALAYPERLKLDLPTLDLFSVQTLTFQEPDLGRYPCLDLAFNACKAGVITSYSIHYTKLYDYQSCAVLFYRLKI